MRTTTARRLTYVLTTLSLRLTLTLTSALRLLLVDLERLEHEHVSGTRTRRRSTAAATLLTYVPPAGARRRCVRRGNHINLKSLTILYYCTIFSSKYRVDYATVSTARQLASAGGSEDALASVALLRPHDRVPRLLLPPRRAAGPQRSPRRTRRAAQVV